MLQASRQVRLAPAWERRRNLSAERPPSPIAWAPRADQKAQLERQREGSCSAAWFPTPKDRASPFLMRQAKRKRPFAPERSAPGRGPEGLDRKRPPGRV